MNETIRDLLRAALRSPEGWAAFSTTVPARFVPGLMGVLYDLTVIAVMELGHPPSPAGLIKRVEEWGASTGQLITDELDEVKELVFYDGPVLSPAEIEHIGYQYAANIYKQEVANTIVEAAPADVEAHLRQAATELKGLKPVPYISDADMASAWYNMKEDEIVKINNTGVDFIDDFIGGIVNGWTYSLLGVTGSAKSSSGIQLAVTYAMKLRREWIENNRKSPLGRVFYITTEDGAKAIQLRMLSFGAVVNRDQLSGKSKIPLTKKGDYSVHDKQLANHEWFKAVFSEEDRVRIMKHRFSDNLRVIDIRDDTVIPRGLNPIIYLQQQIAAVLASAPGSYCALIVLDHCETIISRLLSTAIRGSSRWEIAERVPELIRDELAIRFDTPLWAIHQVSGTANEKAVHARINHTDGKGTKSWGTYFNVCMSVTKIDRKDNTCLWQITKNRDGAISADKKLRLHGEYGLLEEVPNVQNTSGEKGPPRKKVIKDEKRKVRYED